MVGGAHGLIGHRVLKYVPNHYVLGTVGIRESDNAFVPIPHPLKVEKIVLVTVAKKKLVMPEVPQVAIKLVIGV